MEDVKALMKKAMLQRRGSGAGNQHHPGGRGDEEAARHHRGRSSRPALPWSSSGELVNTDPKPAPNAHPYPPHPEGGISPSKSSKERGSRMNMTTMMGKGNALYREYTSVPSTSGSHLQHQQQSNHQQHQSSSQSTSGATVQKNRITMQEFCDERGLDDDFFRDMLIREQKHSEAMNVEGQQLADCNALLQSLARSLPDSEQPPDWLNCD